MLTDEYIPTINIFLNHKYISNFLWRTLKILFQPTTENDFQHL